MSGEAITATLRVKLKPWAVPSFAQRAGMENSSEASSVPVADLDDDALDDMALAWLLELYTKAGRRPCPFYRFIKEGPSQ